MTQLLRVVLVGLVAIVGPDRVALAADRGAQDIVAARLTEYARAFPELYFLHLQGAKDTWAVEALPRFLGEGAANLDYAHPQAARRLLLDTQAGRILQMLESGQPSATLFRTGRNNAAAKPYACVITLDDQRLIADPMAATAFMLGEAASRVTVEAMLDNRLFLHFVLDHEVFHCLDAYLNGPSHPRTFDVMRSHYFDFRTEYRADLFAALATRRMHVNANTFLRAMAAYRALAVADFDTPHMTAAALHDALSVPIGDIAPLSLNRLAQAAVRRADHTLPPFAGFRQLLVAAYHAARRSGTNDADMLTPIGDVAQAMVDETKVTAIARNLTAAQRMLFRPGESSPDAPPAATERSILMQYVQNSSRAN